MKSTVRDYVMLAEQIRDIATMLGEDVERPAWQQRRLFRAALDHVATALSRLDEDLAQLAMLQSCETEEET